jgi:hypothetical protein
MATIGGSNIVRNGLILELDAANRRSYVSGSTTWRDVSGNNYTGSLTNGPAFNSVNNGNIVLDGSNDYINIPTTTNLNTTTPTVSIWFKSISAISGYPGIIHKASSNSSTNGWYAYLENGGLTFAVKAGDPFSGGSGVYSGPLSLNIWYNVTATIVAGGTTNLYLNSILVSTNNATENFITTDDIRIGRPQTAFWNYWGGAMADILLYNRILSTQEVQQNYNAMKSRFNL